MNKPSDVNADFTQNQIEDFHRRAQEKFADQEQELEKRHVEGSTFREALDTCIEDFCKYVGADTDELVEAMHDKIDFLRARDRALGG